tara:strand:- start:3276 stop:3479 length:204 start_codon:yes stop_codon:yes gene_type:complete
MLEWVSMVKTAGLKFLFLMIRRFKSCFQHQLINSTLQRRSVKINRKSGAVSSGFSTWEEVELRGYLK